MAIGPISMTPKNPDDFPVGFRVNICQRMLKTVLEAISEWKVKVSINAYCGIEDLSFEKVIFEPFSEEPKKGNPNDN